MAAKTEMRTEKKQHGQVGPDTFAQVERLLESEKIGRTEAIRRVASTSGRLFGTVAANYYRVARQSGTKLRPRKTTAGRRRAGGARKSVGNATTLGPVVAALQQAAKLLRQQQAQIDRLQKENQRFSQIRKLIRGA